MTTASTSPPSSFALDVQAQLQQVIDHTSAAVFVKDLDGRYVFVNREFERLKGVPVAAIVGHSDDEIFPTAAADFRRNDQRVIAERRALDFEEQIETPQGRRTYLSHKFPLLDATGGAFAVCGIATDITDRKRGEEACGRAALAVSSAEGEQVFGELVRYLSEVLDVDVAMIAVFADDERTRMRTLAARLDGKPLANFEYALEGSPCRAVVGREFRFVGAGVQSRVPARNAVRRERDGQLRRAPAQRLRRTAARADRGDGSRADARSGARRGDAQDLRDPGRGRDRAHALGSGIAHVRGQLSRDLRGERGSDLRP